MENKDFRQVLQGRIPAQDTLDFMKETGRKLNEFSLAMNDVKNEIKNITEKTAETHDMLKEHIKDQIKFQNDFECMARNEHDKIYKYANENFASKEVEKILKRVNWLIIAFFLTALLGLVLLFGVKIRLP